MHIDVLKNFYLFLAKTKPYVFWLKRKHENETLKYKPGNDTKGSDCSGLCVCVCVCVAFLFRCSSVSMNVIRWDFYTRISQCTLSVSALFIYWVCIFIVCVRVCACQIHVRAMHTYRWCRMDEWNKPLLDLFIHLFERMNSSYFYPRPPPPLSSSVVHAHTARLQPPAPLWPLYILMCK